MSAFLGRALSLAVTALIVATGTPRAADAAELVMFARAGCIWCQRWDRDIAPIYDKTDEAKVLPLRRIDIDRGTPPDIALASPVIYTPTFVAIDNGREIGRIVGYINDISFWGLLGNFAAQVKSAPART